MKSFKIFLGVLVALALQVAQASRDAFLLEDPTIWFAFDTNEGSNPVRHYGGTGTLTIQSNGTQSFAANEDGGGRHIVAASSQGMWGDAMPLGDRDWTFVLRAKSVTTANAILFSLGYVGVANSVVNRGLVLHTGDDGTMKLSVIANFTIWEASCSFAVENPTTTYHDYAVAFSRYESLVRVYVDGVFKTQMAYENYSPTNKGWQFAALYGGTGNQSVLVNGAGVCIDDFRFYNRILAERELLALKEGRTSVPVFGGFLGTSDQLIWPKVRLQDVYRFRARLGGSAISRCTGMVFYPELGTDTVALQFQAPNETTYNKAVKVRFAQTSAGVTAKTIWAKYCTPSAGGVNGTLGNDFNVNPQTGQSIALGNELSGFGAYALTADVLTDGQAAVWKGADGDLSDAANYTNATAVVAGGNLSFREGAGRVRNDFAAGTAFGTLAFGRESGSWNLVGNAATFAEVVNASTNAQTLGFAMPYAGDFKPESWGPITFTDLTVGGTFQPFGSGDVRFAGTNEIAYADLRGSVHTADLPSDMPAYLRTASWSAGSGYTQQGKIPQVTLTSLPGAKTRFGSLLPNLRGQIRSNLAFNGDFTIGGQFRQGHDSFVSVTQGTVTLENPFQPNDENGINAYLCVAADAAFCGPAFYPSYSLASYTFTVENAGLLSFNEICTSNSSIRIAGAGTTRTERIQGAVTLDGQTLQPRGSLLTISATTTFAQGGCATTGVTYRAATPAGEPALIEQTGGFVPSGVPFTVTGGGRFRSGSTAPVTFAELTIGAATTADFSAASSVTITNLTLCADATLVLPIATNTLDQAFQGAVTLPAEGRATIALAVSEALTPGVYTLIPSGLTDEQRGHLDVQLVGEGAAHYTLSQTIEGGALTVTVAEGSAEITPAVSGEKSATLVAAGYTGSRDLCDFPVCVKLPDCVPGFRFDETLADGSDVWFDTSDGAFLSSEIECWDAEKGHAVIWVKVPVLCRETAIRMHWGGGTAYSNTPTDVWSANYVGVWHMSEQAGDAENSADPNFPAVPYQGANGDTNLMVGCAGKVGGGRVNDVLEKWAGNSYRVANYNSKNVGDTFTISGWVYAQGVELCPRLFSRKNAYTESTGWELPWNNGPTSFYFDGRVGTGVTFTGFTSAVGQWVHYTFVYNGTTALFYCNGELFGTKTIRAASDNGKPLGIGCDANGDDRTFGGNLDEIRLRDAVADADWIKAAYDTMAKPMTFLVCTAVSIPCSNVLTLNTDELAGSYDAASVTAEKVVVTGSAPVTISGSAGPNVKYWDFSATTGKVTLNLNTDRASVCAGADTVLTQSGNGALLIGSGKKASVPCWTGPLQNAGTLCYTAPSRVVTAPTSGTTEYASTHFLSFASATTPLVLSGTVTVANAWALFNFLEAPVTVKEGAHVTFVTEVRVGDENVLKGHGTYGARFIQEGGLVESVSGQSFWPNGRYGAEERETSLEIRGGRFTVPFAAWAAATTADLKMTTIRVGGTGVFAPGGFTFRNPSVTHSGAMRYYATVEGTGRFVIPSSTGVPAHLQLTVGAGSPMLASEDGKDGSFAGPLILPEEATLTIPAQSTVILRGRLSGAGTLEIARGGVLDLTETAAGPTNFTGRVHVRAGGVLIVPSARVPSYSIALDAGAQVIAAVEDEPSATPTFLGALVDVPTEGRATITFDLPHALLEGTRYTLSTNVLDATAAAHLALTFVGQAYETTHGTIELTDAGAVQAHITDSSVKGALEWHAGRVSTDAAERAWTLYGSDDATLLPFAGYVPLYFTDKGTYTGVTFGEGVSPSLVTVDSAQDYTFMGSAIRTPALVKTGTGTLTLNNELNATTNVLVKSGVLRIGQWQSANLLGAAETQVRIEPGASLDLNQHFTAAADTALGLSFQNAIVSIEGAGANGQGAITDSATCKTWQHNFGRVVMTGDATVGGTSRIDLRKYGNAYAGTVSLTGPTNATLTVKTHVDETVDCGFNFHTATVSLGRIVLAEGGMLGLENATTLNVPGGIELQKNARLHFWGTSGEKTKIVVTGEGAGIKTGGTESSQDQFVTVQKDASLDLRGDSKLTLTGGLANEGEMTSTSATYNFEGGAVTNNGSILVRGGELQLYLQTCSGQGSFTVTNGVLRLGSYSATYDGDFKLNMTGGAMYWYFPKMTENSSIDASGIVGGTLGFRATTNATLPTAFTQARPDCVLASCTDGWQTVLTIPKGCYDWTKANLGTGTSFLEANVRLEDGADVRVKSLSMGEGSGGCKGSAITINTGATLTVNDSVRVAHWTGTGWQRLVVNGGTFDHQDEDDNTRVGWDGNSGFIDINAGTVKTRGFTCFRSWRDPGSTTARVVMNGGTLELAERHADGDAIGGWTQITPFVVFNGGTIESMNNWNVEGMAAVAFGTQPGGQVQFNLNGKTVNWRTGLQGQADVTLQGPGVFTSGVATEKLRFQGVNTGAWTIDDTTSCDLTGAAGFLGGLHLKENVAANIRIAGSNLVEACFLKSGLNSFNTVCSGSGYKGTYPFTCNDMSLMHARSEEEDFTGGTILWQGLFYVDRAGTWTFASGYDDSLYLEIDGKQVIKNASHENLVSGQISLTVGWHAFRIVQYQKNYAWGANDAEWNAMMSLGFAKADLSDTSVLNYTKFDGAHIPMKVSNASFKYAGLDGMIELEAGAILTNDATADSCPIWGTLKGAGKLVGKFAFAGDKNALAITGSGTVPTVTRPNVTRVKTRTAFAKLRKVSVLFEKYPTCSTYDLGPSLGADPTKIDVEVKTAKGRDCSSYFSAFVQDGTLYLKNSAPKGTVFLLR